MPDHTPYTGAGWISRPNPTLYSPENIRRYGDLIVGKSHKWAWKLDNTRLQDLYLSHVRDPHLEIGPADLHFLDRTPAPAMAHQWQVDVVDINTAPLDTAKEKLTGRAQVRTHEHDVLALPWPVKKHHFLSLAIGNVLHCLPGAGFTTKTAVIQGMAEALADDGVAWGYTLTGAQDPMTRTNLLARVLMWHYNKADNIFSNRGDRFTDLERELKMYFAAVEICPMGSAAVFVVGEPIR
ncbi:hypothetical protein ACOQFV_02335 [Nocardiopsis changdeensis]|uniref:Class I SAM-dependent methyltransferase n=1 Tax=Nocardiopsis changdeensis TaxID=2831969 RepID=A0ABX8BKE5_9ACTN|nr:MULTISPECIES: hypothetical protein [Nocardiopsis]QUX22482.1 class I SAM-dependent methyltransferase [Nocardiopsis changdeensis]QYX38424.1 hypothetical protein K1J57_07295 [Nocardiopsis sp. MT53]